MAGLPTSSPLPPPPPAPVPRRPADVSGRLVFLFGLVVTAGVVAGVARAWPDDGGPATASASPSTTLMTKEAAEAFVPPAGAVDDDVDALPVPATVPGVPPARLFEGELPEAFAAVARAIDDGGTARLLELVVYPDRLQVAYVPPSDPQAIDQVTWTSSGASAPRPNLIDDRVDADTAPDLFDRSDVRLDLLAQLVADAPSRYGVPVEVTHVIIDRFLPFDQRVLVRVYASPTDGRSGGGYVSYVAADGAYVRTCC